MTSRDFCFWLQGYFEIHNKEEPLYEGQLEIIKKHLAMVFIHEIDPSMPNKKLDQVHAQQINPSTAIMRC
jgi:predicted ferric reductase